MTRWRILNLRELQKMRQKRRLQKRSSDPRVPTAMFVMYLILFGIDL